MTAAPDATHSLGTSLTTTFIQDSVRLAPELGPVFRRSLHNLEFTFVTSPALVAELSDERRFTKHVMPNLAALRPLLGDGLITAHTDEPNWRIAHELLMPAFTQSAMRRYHPIMLEVAGELVRAWDRATEPVDVAEDMTKVTLEAVGRAGFSYSFDSFASPRTHPFVVALKECMAHGQRSVTRPRIVGGLLGARAEARAAENIAYLNAVVDEVIDARGGARGGHDDLLDLMLAAGTLDRANIRHQVLTFLVAGYETTASTAAFALHFLASDPELLATVRAEADAVLGDGPPAFEQIAKLRLLRRVVDETLRLWPPAPGFARQALADTVLGGRYPLRAGESVLVLLPALHRDPVWGADPERFDPDRFLPERVRARPAHTFKPFGTGQRACIGRQFALHETLVVLSTVLRRYELAPDPAYQLRVQELITFRPTGFALVPRRRTG